MTRFVTLHRAECQELELRDAYQARRALGCWSFHTTFLHTMSAWPCFCYGSAVCEELCRGRGESFDANSLVNVRWPHASGAGLLGVSRSNQRFPPKLRDFVTSTICELPASAESAAIDDFVTST